MSPDVQTVRARQLAALIFTLAFACVVRAECKALRTDDTIVMQNSLLKLTIDLRNGARVSEYVYKPFGENLVYPVASCGGLLMDHVWEQTWPGEFLYRKYDAEIVKPGPEEAIVRVWTIGTGDTVKGVRVERLITLKAGDRVVYCSVSLKNTSDQGRVTGYWSQNNFWLMGKKENNIWSRPCTRGIDHMGWDWQTYNWYYVDDATAGWNGVSNKALQVGVMFLMDYNDLWRLYDNGQAVTTEWMYDKVAIPAGKTWTTEIHIIPVAGITGFTHGSPRLVANFEVSQVPGGLAIEHQLTRSIYPLKDVTVSTKVWGLKTQWTAAVPDVKFAELTDAVQRAAVTATGVGAVPAGIQVTVTGTMPDGQKATETYGDYFGGAEGKNNDPFTMKPYLRFERPPKKKTYLKPDVIRWAPNPEPRVLYLRGLWTSYFRVDEALKEAFPNATILDGWLDASPVGYALTYFPADYPSLTSFDLIILGNVPAAPLDLVGQEMLKDYVEAGGNLLVLGGDQAFGQAGFTNPALIAQIPVELGGGFDWRKIAGGATLRVVMDAPAAKGVQFGPADVVLYRHICRPKPDAAVVVKAGEHPILVTSDPGKAGGRVACVLALPFGEVEKGQVAFWDSPAWKTLMERTVRWLMKR